MTATPRLVAARALLVAVAVASAAACGLHMSLDAEARNEWTREYTLATDGTLEIRNPNGRTEIVAGDVDAVTVQAERVVNAANQEAADTALASFEIAETVSPDRVVLDSTQSGGGMSINLSRKVNYRVTLPRRANVKLTGSNGEVEVDGVEGRVEISVSNGRVTARGLGGPASVRATNGAVSVAMARLSADGVECETTNGMITLMLPRDAGADLSARVTNGGISHEGLDVQVLEESRRRLDARIGGGGPDVRLQTTNGAIRIRANQ